jgi:uncharacterized RDD family membrane protein YckC
MGSAELGQEETHMDDKRVGFGPRLGAALIDCVLVMVVGFVFGGIIGGALGLGAGALTGAATDEAGAAAAAAAVGFVGGMMAGTLLVMVLYGLIEAFTGASPGKMILKLKIGTDDGRTAPTSTYVTRWAVKYSSSILSTLGLLTGLGFLGTIGSLAGLVILVGCFMVLGASKQAIHDLAAKTAVYNRADLL